MLAQKKTNRNCCTAALAVNLLLFSVSYYLHHRCKKRFYVFFYFGHVSAFERTQQTFSQMKKFCI